MRIGCVKIKMDCGDKHKKLRVVPIIGPFVEQSGVAIKTPQFQSPHRESYLMALITMTDSQQTTLRVKFKDKKGNPATLPAGASITWLVDNAAMLALTPAADGLSCLVVAVGPEGTATASMKAADSAGNPVAAGSVDFDIIGGAPITADVAGDPPVEQP